VPTGRLGGPQNRSEHGDKGKGKTVHVLNYAPRQDVLGSGGIAPRLLDHGTGRRCDHLHVPAALIIRK
jgi:hypothetical protein